MSGAMSWAARVAVPVSTGSESGAAANSDSSALAARRPLQLEIRTREELGMVLHPPA
jgi:hypothetical protein